MVFSRAILLVPYAILIGIFVFLSTVNANVLIRNGWYDVRHRITLFGYLLYVFVIIGVTAWYLAGVDWRAPFDLTPPAFVEDYLTQQ